MEKVTDTSFSGWVKRVQTAKGISNVECVRRIRAQGLNALYDVTAWSQLRRSKVRTPTHATILKVAAALEEPEEVVERAALGRSEDPIGDDRLRFRHEIARNLNGARSSMGVSTYHLAGILGISVEMVERWESGVEDPPAYILLQISNTLEVPVAMLYGEATEGGSVWAGKQLATVKDLDVRFTKLEKLICTLLPDPTHGRKREAA